MRMNLEAVAVELSALEWEVVDLHPRWGEGDDVPGYLWATTHNEDNVDFNLRLDDDATGFIGTKDGGGYSKSIPFTPQTLGTFELLARYGYRVEVSEQQLERISHEDALALALQSVADAAAHLIENGTYHESGDLVAVLLGRYEDVVTALDAARALGWMTTDERLDAEAMFSGKGTGFR